jgi:hypothetical protein
VNNNIERIIEVFDDFLAGCIEVKTFVDPKKTEYLRPQIINIVSGLQVFKPIAILFLE